MFDIGFWELCLVGLVSLLVIGPERLPKAARLAGFWLGKTRRVIASVKSEIKQELQAEEIRQIYQQQAELEEFHTLVNESKETIEEIRSSIKPVDDNLDKPTDESK